jgi:threonyl-tRNA synthetase
MIVLTSSQVLWHSAAHVLGAALQEHFGGGAQMTDGPPLTEDASGGGGFFYEFYLSDGRRITDADFEALTKISKKLIKSKARFDSVVVDKATAAKVFADNPFKLALLDVIPPHDPITLYRCGDFVDLCRGPHVPHTGIIKVCLFGVIVPCGCGTCVRCARCGRVAGFHRNEIFRIALGCTTGQAFLWCRCVK